MRLLVPAAMVAALLGGSLGSRGLAQQTPELSVRPIDPPADPLPPEESSAATTRFSFIAYGDTRSMVDGQALQPDHGALVAKMLEYIYSRATSDSPVRFIVQSGDAVVRGPQGDQWNVSFSPLVERLTRGANLPYFFTIGNHDAPSAPEGARALGLRNALAAMSKLIPPEGSPRRLSGYPTYAFGYGNLFAIALDSNIASDATQLSWVTDQLDHLDRRRYRHVLVIFHHPMISSGPHGGSSPKPSGAMAEDSVEPQTAALRRLYAPIFRRHHVRMTISGHDHLLDHFVERYTDNGVAYRRDDVVTGGGGAPTYTYRGEPALTHYLAAGADHNVRVQHLMRPGATIAENPHHFLVIHVDGERVSMEVIAVGMASYLPYGGLSRVDLNDP